MLCNVDEVHHNKNLTLCYAVRLHLVRFSHRTLCFEKRCNLCRPINKMKQLPRNLQLSCWLLSIWCAKEFYLLDLDHLIV